MGFCCCCCCCCMCVMYVMSVCCRRGGHAEERFLLNVPLGKYLNLHSSTQVITSPLLVRSFIPAPSDLSDETSYSPLDRCTRIARAGLSYPAFLERAGSINSTPRKVRCLRLARPLEVMY
ncbi:hypothetical protein EJ06DRAFT_31931 [Trichodelitschia bisporula]|uniref:Secreted protein n=1 Tax=Trichodelitschia bisporula TaxID=703511 RepID=A0A6G1IC55_9PEZI|nr:hypothetical protein EJ06DRAFT_31931 [Trichodelitschia bisporula]